MNGVGARSWRAAAAKPLHCRESPRHIRQRSVDPVSMALIAESQQRRWEGVVQASRSTGRLQLRGASLDAGSAATVVQLLLSEEKQPWHVDLEGNELGDRGALCVAELLRQSTHLAWLGLGACGIGPLGGVALASALSESRSLTALDLSSSAAMAGPVRNSLGRKVRDGAPVALPAPFPPATTSPATPAVSPGAYLMTRLLSLSSTKVVPSGKMTTSVGLSKGLFPTVPFWPNKNSPTGATALSTTMTRWLPVSTMWSAVSVTATLRGESSSFALEPRTPPAAKKYSTAERVECRSLYSYRALLPSSSC